MTPIEALGQVVSSVIAERWRAIRASAALEEASTTDLQTALDYLNARQQRVAHVKYSSLTPRAEREHDTTTETVSPTVVGFWIAVGAVAFFFILRWILRNLLPFLLAITVIAAVIVSVILFVRLASPVVHWFENRFGSLRVSPAMSLFAFLAIALTPVWGMIRSGIYDIGSLFFIAAVFVPLYIYFMIERLGYDWVAVKGDLSWMRGSSAEQINSERMEILNVLSERRERRSTGEVEDTRRTQEMIDMPVPAPPGITEIVLLHDELGAFDSMRKHLSGVRFYHRAVLWTIVIAFMAFIAVGLSKFFSSLDTPSDYAQAFGSAGIGGVLLWFGQRALWANRVSQLSLALLESHIAEVNSSLRELPPDASPEERRSARSEIWKTFRIGLNEIWLSEQRLSSRRDVRTREGFA